MKLVVVLLVVALVYAAACWLLPYTSCFRCAGRGWHRGLIRRGRTGDCRWCNSSGQRLRAGRRVYNALARAHREGQAERTEKAGSR